MVGCGARLACGVEFEFGSAERCSDIGGSDGECGKRVRGLSHLTSSAVPGPTTARRTAVAVVDEGSPGHRQDRSRPSAAGAGRSGHQEREQHLHEDHPKTSTKNSVNSRDPTRPRESRESPRIDGVRRRSGGECRGDRAGRMPGAVPGRVLSGARLRDAAAGEPVIGAGEQSGRTARLGAGTGTGRIEIGAGFAIALGTGVRETPLQRSPQARNRRARVAEPACSRRACSDGCPDRVGAGDAALRRRDPERPAPPPGRRRWRRPAGSSAGAGCRARSPAARPPRSAMLGRLR